MKKSLTNTPSWFTNVGQSPANMVGLLLAFMLFAMPPLFAQDEDDDILDLKDVIHEEGPGIPSVDSSRTKKIPTTGD